jgi:competence protein ComFC
VSFWDFIFPKKCVNCKKFGEYLCDNCFSLLSYDVLVPCVYCQKKSFDGNTHPGCKNLNSLDGAFAAVRYNKPIKKLVRSFKYKPYLKDLRKYISDLFIEGIIQNEDFMRVIKKQSKLVPVPLHSARLKNRGYNHADLLTDNLSEYFGLEKVDIVERTRETSSQFGLSLSERRLNLKKAFKVRKEGEFDQVILIDDIVTTGSTFIECAKVLKKSGTRRVYGLAFAHGK